MWRSIAFSAACFALAGLKVASVAEHRILEPARPTAVRTGQFLSVEPAAHTTDFRFQAQKRARYLLIVGNLSERTDNDIVTLSCIAPAAVGPVASLHVVPDVASRIDRAGALGTPDVSGSGAQVGTSPRQAPGGQESKSVRHRELAADSVSGDPSKQTRRANLSGRIPVRTASFSPVQSLVPLRTRVFAGASQQGATDATIGRGRESLEFSVHVTDGSPDDERQYVNITSRVVRSGRRVRICLDDSQSLDELDPALLDQIVADLDDDLIPAMTADLGPICDVDHNGKLTVLLTPWLDRLRGGTVSLKGFVRPTDFHPGAQQPFGSRCDMIYLNSSLRPGAGLTTLLAHELTHVIACSRVNAETAGPHPPALKQDWLNEGIAHVAERHYGADWSNLGHRLSRFLDAPQLCPLVVDNYSEAGLWRDDGCRGATYLFNQWCADQGGADLLRDVIAARERGTDCLTRVTGHRFEDLFRRWTIDVASSLFAHTSDAHSAMPLTAGVDDWGLVGPVPVEWDLGDGPFTIPVHGTAAAYVVFDSDADAVKRIRVSSRDRSTVQLTLVRLPRTEHRPILDVTVRETPPTEPVGNPIRVRVTIGGETEPEFVSLELESQGRHRSRCYHSRQLKEHTVASHDRDGTDMRTYEFTLSQTAEASPSRLTVKALRRGEGGEPIVFRLASRPVVSGDTSRTRLRR